MNADVQSLKEQLERLERSNRRIKLGCAIAFVCLAGIVAMGAQGTAKRTVEASDFVLRDAGGHMRARLFSGNGGPSLALYHNPDAVLPNLVISTSADGGKLSIFGGQGEKTAMASIFLGKNGPDLKLIDTQGFETHLGVTETKNANTGEARKTSVASLVMFGRDGKVIWSAP